LFCPELYDRLAPKRDVDSSWSNTKLKLGARKMRQAQNNQLKTLPK